MKKKRGWIWRNWKQNRGRKADRTYGSSLPDGIKVRLRRYRKPIKGYSFSVQVKKKDEWQLIDMFKTEDEACLEINKQLNLLDFLLDLS